MSPTASQRTASQLSLWRLAAYLHVVYAHLPKAEDVNDILAKISSVALSRIRRIIEEQLKDDERSSLLNMVSPDTTPFATAVLHPESFEAFEDAFDDVLPIHAVSTLRRLLGLQTSATLATSLSSQFLIEGLDGWLSLQPQVEQRRLVQSCGASPAAIDQGLAVNPFALIDFVIDVIYPEGSALWSVDPSSDAAVPDARRAEGDEAGTVSVNDWVAWVYYQTVKPRGDSASAALFAANRAAIKHQAPPSVVVDEPVSSNASPTSALPPSEEEEYLTESNLEHMMTSHPNLVPREVIVARRRTLLDPNISALELQSHYSVPELKKEVQDVLGRVAPATPSQAMDWRGKKEDIAQRLHAMLPEIRALVKAAPPICLDVDADSTSDEVIDVVDDIREIVTDTMSTVKSRSKNLVEKFSRDELNSFLVADAPRGLGLTADDAKKFKTKLDCAKHILKMNP